MNRLEALETAHRDGINLSWLVKLRWAAMAGQLLTIAVVHQLMGIALRLLPLLGLIALGVATNVAAFGWTVQGRVVPRWAIPGLMILDTLLLTALLYLSGGPFNPFSFLYLVQIALAAVVLPERSTWTLVILSLACSAFLFVGYQELPLGRMSHGEHMRMHLIGMWVAFGVAAAFIVYFLLRIMRALATRDAELETARSRMARQEKYPMRGRRFCWSTTIRSSSNGWREPFGIEAAMCGLPTATTPRSRLREPNRPSSRSST